MDKLKHIFDGASLMVAAGTVIGWLPTIAAAMSIAWYCYRFYEVLRDKRRGTNGN